MGVFILLSDRLPSREKEGGGIEEEKRTDRKICALLLSLLDAQETKTYTNRTRTVESMRPEYYFTGI